MITFPKTAQSPPKCYFTYCYPPRYVDNQELPTKKKPFSTILGHPFAHTAELILPYEVYEIIKQQLDGSDGLFRYARVHMSLSDILEGDFFNTYLKTGNILMISEGRPGVDNVFSIHEGVLRLELDKATYERCGLVGKPISDGTRKHIQSRFEVKINLRLPSMLHGKPGFERVVYASKNVLNHALTWLFHDFGDTSTPLPVEKYQPVNVEVRGQAFPKQRVLYKDVVTPPIETLCEPTNASNLYEWLGMISLDSPRLDRLDKTDSFLSRYTVPDFDTCGNSETASKTTSRLLMRVVWRGLLNTAFLTKLWLITRKASGDDWGAMSVGCFGNKSYTLLEVGKKGTLVWEAEDREG